MQGDGCDERSPIDVNVVIVWIYLLFRGEKLRRVKGKALSVEEARLLQVRCVVLQYLTSPSICSARRRRKVRWNSQKVCERLLEAVQGRHQLARRA